MLGRRQMSKGQDDFAGKTSAVLHISHFTAFQSESSGPVELCKFC